MEGHVRIRTENVTWQEIDGELVILDLQKSTYLTTNAVGALLAKFLTEERSLADLAGLLTSTFGIDDETALKDSEAFVQQLGSKGLLLSD
jgi:hypothetical protein